VNRFVRLQALFFFALPIVIALVAPTTHSVSAQQAPSVPRFAFWYETWRPDATLRKLKTVDSQAKLLRLT